MYKLIMKVIANRFKIVFHNIILQEQAGFIADRNITDNVIIAQEVIHSIRSKKQNKNWMALKLDVEKAYDRVSWEFINASLQAAGTPVFLISVIMNAITSSLQILWNGIPTQKFTPIRGIRQGCPLSSYLFVLCMEWLSRIIHVKIDDGSWKPIRLSRNGPALSHLLFADDLLIFCQANIDQAHLLSSMLKHFFDFSGHRISTIKSNIHFSKGM